MRTNGHGVRERYVLSDRKSSLWSGLEYSKSFRLLEADVIFLSAGGQAVNSRMERMITITPEHIHDRSGIFMGSYDEVQKVIDMHKKSTH